jgi:hypothetical protein
MMRIREFLGSIWMVLFVTCASALSVVASPAFPLTSNDIVAFVGGADVSSAQQSGHLESLLSCAYLGAHFRNFGWEGDTVYSQPRDFGFPPLIDHLRKAGATVIVLQFGRTEALTEAAGTAPSRFRDTYAALLKEYEAITPRLALVAPPPFENAGGLLPNLATKNPQLAEQTQILRELARAGQFTFVDLFSTASPGERLTDDGLQLTIRGQGKCALSFARQIGLQDCISAAGDLNNTGAWSSSNFEALRQAIILKDRYWFDYWRPQNWAFLGGDRTEQPSSRDHRDPKIRWFPKEIEQFRTLISKQEAEVARLAAEARRSNK